MYRTVAAVILCGLWMFMGDASAQTLICARDLNGDGNVDGPGEQASCVQYPAGHLCPIGQAACLRDPVSGLSRCPTDPTRPCIDDGTGTGTSYCSVNPCFSRSTVTPVITDPPSVTPEDNGPRDASGQCLGELQIFPGKALRCRPGGTQTVGRNCCKNRDGAISDSMGSAADLMLGTKAISAVANAARAAMTGGVAAANQALMAAFDPTTLAVAVAVALITDLLTDQCDDRDIESALLNSSGQCVFLGTYCAEEWPLVGCVQRAQSFCCFNSKLARIIHEQGRPQLPVMNGFGTPEEPNCRGFKPEEFQSLDFSKIDLSEYYEELKVRSQTLIEESTREAAQRKLGQ